MGVGVGVGRGLRVSVRALQGEVQRTQPVAHQGIGAWNRGVVDVRVCIG